MEMCLCMHLGSCDVSDILGIGVFSRLQTLGLGSVLFMQGVLFI